MIRLLVYLLIGCTSVSERPQGEGYAMAAEQHYASGVGQSDEPITFYLRNDKGRFRNVSFVLYRPGAEEPEVESRFLMPWQRYKFTLPLGTKLYVATNAELKAVNAGADLRREPADLTVRQDDEGRIYAIKK